MVSSLVVGTRTVKLLDARVIFWSIFHGFLSVVTRTQDCTRLGCWLHYPQVSCPSRFLLGVGVRCPFNLQRKSLPM